TINGTAKALNADIIFALMFDDEGIITGSVTSELPGIGGRAVARGLIGEEGLVGVYANINGAPSAPNLYGGFVADYVAPVPSVATHANFKTYYADSARVVTERLHPTPTTTNTLAAFVEGTATGLPTDGLSFTEEGTFMPVTVKLGGAVEGDSGFDGIDDGFAIMYGFTTNVRYRAGLLSGTDLGPALSGTSTAIWAGSLYLALIGDEVRSVDLSTVTVDFDNGTITAPETEVGVGTGSKVTINGLFRAGSNNSTLPVGILGGTVNFDFSGTARPNQPLIGLIGTKGAIGVFHAGATGIAAAGGFQASPN
ncbi:MAG: hypothetical protein K8953_13520, partial [Proteobacteria bacterium]|nr:hypothetical protein [Pseudomonadota bacterium]